MNREELEALDRMDWGNLEPEQLALKMFQSANKDAEDSQEDNKEETSRSSSSE
jgi:hypothetical protein